MLTYLEYKDCECLFSTNEIELSAFLPREWSLPVFDILAVLMDRAPRYEENNIILQYSEVSIFKFHQQKLRTSAS